MSSYLLHYVWYFPQYVKDELKDYEENVELNLRFCEPSVQLELDEQNSAKGWSIKPYAEPLEVSVEFTV